MDAAQDRADAGRQLSELERLREKVVRAEAEGAHDVPALAPSGEHEHRRLVLRADLSKDLESVDAGKSEVEQDQIGAVRAPAPERLGPSGASTTTKRSRRST